MEQIEMVAERRRARYAARRLARFTQRCRENGLAVTPQRLSIIKALLTSGAHPSAHEVYAAVRKEHPHVSLATVHRTLETLCRVGEARKVTSLYERARYDGNVESHHHVICVNCRRIQDIEGPELDNLIHGASTLGEFTLLGCSIEIHALCGRCMRERRRGGEQRVSLAASGSK